MANWKIISKDVVFKNSYRSVEEWTYEKPDGTPLSLTMVEGADVVIVAAITPDKKFVIIQDFFPNKLEKFPSLVAGMVDEGELPLDAAHRELKEETGCVAGTMVPLGSSFVGKYFNFSIHYFLALDVAIHASQSLEEGEEIDVTIISEEKFEQLVHGTILQSVFDLACAYRALDYIKKNS